MGIWDKAVLIKRAVGSHRHGATVAEVCDWCDRNSIHPIPQSTARSILEGLRQLGVVTRRPSTNAEGTLTYLWLLSVPTPD